MRLVDAHVHLPSYGDPRAVVAGASAVGSFLLSCTVNHSEAALNLLLRRESPASLACFVGVHPSDVTETPPSELLGDAFGAADGIGEIGLDEKYSPVSRDSAQMKAFVDQLAAAERLGKPVQVHSRGSSRLCLDVLGTFRLGAVLMHWFEDETSLEAVRSRGYYVSVGPAVLYSKKVRRIAASVVTDRLLTESDGPVGYATLGGAAGPGLIPSVVFAVSELRRTSYDDALRETSSNAERFLGRSIDPKSGSVAPE